MTSDSKHFPPLDKWIERGFRADSFARYRNSQGEEAVPFFEGRMIGQHNCSQKGWVSGKGRTAVWRLIQNDDKRIEPQYLAGLETVQSWPKANRGVKVAIMDITSSTNTRSMIAVATSYFPFGHSAPVLTVNEGDFAKTLYLPGVLNSFVFDFAARPRVSGVHFTWFILEECPLPRLSEDSTAEVLSLAQRTARLSLLHRRFAPEWLRLKIVIPELAGREWKNWWSVTEADRLRQRVEIDALCAELYGLDPDEFDYIVRDDPKDPKGFYRVDRQLPFRERLTGLAAAAFRALMEGKWSVESAATLSNDEFFDLLGIPELTSAAAAKAKELPSSLIEKRNGCHVWKPESFPADDPRHGWTWDHCYQDAVAVLGSDEAVEDYLKEKPNESTEGEEEEDSFQLENDKPKPKQKKMF
jgi:hypothetical protein